MLEIILCKIKNNFVFIFLKFKILWIKRTHSLALFLLKLRIISATWLHLGASQKI
jgi:hypothetical protein